MAIRRVLDEDLDEATEGWVGERVSVFRMTGRVNSWHVEVGAMEGLRGGAEGDVRQAIATALRSVSGVEDVREEDREVWDVTGNPSGEAMAQAVDTALLPYTHAIEDAAGTGPVSKESQLRADWLKAKTMTERIDFLRANGQSVQADSLADLVAAREAGADKPPRKMNVGAVSSSMPLTLVSVRLLSETSVLAEFVDRETQSTVETEIHVEMSIGHPLATRSEPDVLSQSGGSVADLRNVHHAVIGFLQAGVRKSRLSDR